MRAFEAERHVRLLVQDHGIADTPGMPEWALDYLISHVDMHGPYTIDKPLTLPTGHVSYVFRKITSQNRIILALVTGEVYDNKRWMHLSVSLKTRQPMWDELVEAKEAILGREIKAIKIIPPRSEYVNLHPHCLHVWACIDGDPIPDGVE